jgi:hypothetical protein
MRGWSTTRARRSWSGARVGGYRLCGRWQRLQAASLLQARYLHGGVAGGLHAARDTQGARAPHSEVVRYPLLDRVHLGGVERGAEGSVTGEHGCGPSSGTPSNRSAHALSAHRSGPARRTGASPSTSRGCPLRARPPTWWFVVWGTSGSTLLSLLQHKRAAAWRPLHGHRGRRPRGYLLDAERACAGRGGTAVCSSAKPQASLPFVGGVHALACGALPVLQWVAFRAGRPAGPGPSRARARAQAGWGT